MRSDQRMKYVHRRVEIEFDKVNDDCKWIQNDWYVCLHPRIVWGWEDEEEFPKSQYEYRNHCEGCTRYEPLKPAQIKRLKAIAQEPNEMESIGYVSYTKQHIAIAYPNLSCPKPKCNSQIELRIKKDGWEYYCPIHKQLLTRTHKAILKRFVK